MSLSSCKSCLVILLVLVQAYNDSCNYINWSIVTVYSVTSEKIRLSKSVLRQLSPLAETLSLLSVTTLYYSLMWTNSFCISSTIKCAREIISLFAWIQPQPTINIVYQCVSTTIVNVIIVHYSVIYLIFLFSLLQRNLLLIQSLIISRKEPALQPPGLPLNHTVMPPHIVTTILHWKTPTWVWMVLVYLLPLILLLH